MSEHTVKKVTALHALAIFTIAIVVTALLITSVKADDGVVLIEATPVAVVEVVEEVPDTSSDEPGWFSSKLQSLKEYFEDKEADASEAPSAPAVEDDSSTSILPVIDDVVGEGEEEVAVAPPSLEKDSVAPSDPVTVDVVVSKDPKPVDEAMDADTLNAQITDLLAKKEEIEKK